MDLADDGFSLELIPETQSRTNLGSVAIGDLVNLEADVLAKYVERLAAPALAARSST
jgi:riboflavin synthase